jgi:hypothetical protein
VGGGLTLGELGVLLVLGVELDDDLGELGDLLLHHELGLLRRLRVRH